MTRPSGARATGELLEEPPFRLAVERLVASSRTRTGGSERTARARRSAASAPGEVPPGLEEPPPMPSGSDATSPRGRPAGAPRRPPRARAGLRRGRSPRASGKTKGSWSTSRTVARSRAGSPPARRAVDEDPPAPGGRNPRDRGERALPPARRDDGDGLAGATARSTPRGAGGRGGGEPERLEARRPRAGAGGLLLPSRGTRSRRPRRRGRRASVAGARRGPREPPERLDGRAAKRQKARRPAGVSSFARARRLPQPMLRGRPTRHEEDGGEDGGDQSSARRTRCR